MNSAIDTLLNSQSVILFTALMGVMLLTFGVLSRFLLAKRELDLKRYDMELQRAKISDDRHYFEGQMAELAARLAASEERWRDANQLVMSGIRSGQDATRPETDSAFLDAFGVKQSDRIIDPKLVFVLTPFSDEELPSFRVIQEVCSGLGLRAVRGDESFTSGDILTHVVSLLAKSRMVIANISTRNANVYYELGIAHGLNKPTILVSRSISEAPFDLKNQRIVIYRSNTELRNGLTTALAQAFADPKLLGRG